MSERDPRERGRFQYWLEVEHAACGFDLGATGDRPANGFNTWICRVRWPRSMGCTATARCPLAAIHRALRAHRAWRGRINRREAVISREQFNSRTLWQAAGEVAA